jgi:GTPase involved in cell partitioning and DNA repair
MGGVGGVGGDVSACTKEGSNLKDLARLKTRRFLGGVGGVSERSRAAGKKGASISITVPPGTVVYNEQERMVTTCTQSTLFLYLHMLPQVCDLDDVHMSHVLARGGTGGSHMTPNWHGRPGQRGVFILKLKSIADVGLVG